MHFGKIHVEKDLLDNMHSITGTKTTAVFGTLKAAVSGVDASRSDVEGLLSIPMCLAAVQSYYCLFSEI